VHLGVGVGAGVGEHGDPVVEVGRLADGGEHDAARGEAREHERVGPRAAQQHVEVAAAERADPPLDDDRLVGQRRERRVHLGGRVVLREPVTRLRKAGERRVGVGDLGITGPEGHPDKHHGDALGPRGLGRTVGGVNHGRAAGPLDDAVLEVHQEQDGAGIGHDVPPRGADGLFSQNLTDEAEYHLPGSALRRPPSGGDPQPK
jgi:hypothetical protein